MYFGSSKLTEDSPVLKITLTGETEQRCVEWKCPNGHLRNAFLTCYEVQIMPINIDTEAACFYLYGDLCAIRAKVLRLHPFLNQLGIKNRCSIEMIYNGYKNVADYQSFPVEAFPLSEKKSWKSFFWKLWTDAFSEKDSSNWIKSATLESTYFPLINASCEPYVGSFYLTVNTGGLSSTKTP